MENNEEIVKEFPEFPLMVQYEKQILLDITENDALLVTAKGISDHIVILNFLRAHNHPSNLILIINSEDHEQKFFTEKLKLEQLPLLSNERERFYLNGGIYFASTRIVVVDMLKNRVPMEHLTGIVVFRAHSILESCQEAFALRLYRQKNKTGFIKAFSHSAERFTFGFSHVEKVMRSLFVKELFLWPRFHGSIIECLKAKPPNVIELQVPLSNKGIHIQTCILDIMNYTTKELKRINNRYVDLEEITVENCIAKRFHQILQAQLEPVWHQLSARSKDLVQDLKVMRELIMKLLHHDSITFYSLVSKYRTPEYAKLNSGWILLDAAEQLFTYARSRVFNSRKEFEPEECPKWKYLNEILSVEIPSDAKKNSSDNNPIKVLILCRDSMTCYQLSQFLTIGAQPFLWNITKYNKLEVSSLSEKYKQYESSEYFKSKKKNKSSNNKEEEQEQELDEIDLSKTTFVFTMTQTTLTNETADMSLPDATIFEPFTQFEDGNVTQLEAEKPLIYIQTFKDNSNSICLEESLKLIQPNYIIMYHSDITATRQIELFEARRDKSLPKLTVYFLIHAHTTEEQAYLTTLRREKEAFELLIQTKSSMVIPSYQDGKEDLPSYFENDEPSTSSRKAGGQDDTLSKEKPRVIVDMREFRSDLPALLHKKGIDTDPVTISIGDYILTPEICVERKSLSDLIGSLNSGRLYTQCTQMCRNYARPMLLIEFDQNKPFQLQNNFVASNEINGADIQQKLQLLTLHFPRLKLIWSPSPYATVELFYELKQGRPQPNSADAIALGEDAAVDGLSFESYNLRIRDFLLKLPGVTSKNIGNIINKGVSLDNIIKMSKDELNKLTGNKTDGGALWNILHNTYKQPSASTDDKLVKKNRFGKPMRGKRYK